MKFRFQRASLPACLAAAAFALLATGCAAPGSGNANITASENNVAKVSNVGFLSDPGKLRAQPANGGFLCWRQAGVDWRVYDKVMIERIKVYVTPASDQSPIDPSDLKALIDYFHSALVKNLSPTVKIVDAPGPGVLRVRLALTSLVPTNQLASLAGTAVPYGFVAEMGSGAATGRPPGSTPYLGKTGLEAQFRDGATGNVLAECADTQIGLKYAADLKGDATTAAEAWMNGYVSSFTAWSYAQDAFNKWSAAFARRLAELKTQSPQ
ncbi:DUF3313 domain-containing protein [Variovorax sp. J22P168]|uniref:DUF3313 domain-containing protein n=1 Tax=Variovorax jilinensis TaxID=3053513 RepID=UPI002576964A|nr:DUF3313 domain-containing protein [Variovorax sp. J22P168]MDM0011676.1 DUF3313 domain-containing protein [Variovorax sp. J22P168]